MRHQQQIYYAALTQFENVGDALINRELLKAVSKRASLRCYVGGCPAEYVAQLEQPSSSLVDRPLNGMLIDLAHAGLATRSLPREQRPILLATPGDVNGRLRLNNVIKAVTYLGLSLLGVRIWRIGVSFTHLSPARAAVERVALRFMDRVAVRDSGSGEFVRQAGGEPQPIPDLSFLLGYNRGQASTTRRRKVAISFRDQELTAGESATLVHKIIELSAAVSSAGFTPVLTVQVERDLAFAERVRANAPRPIELAVLRTIPEAESFYDTCDMAIGNRLHVLLLAASRGCIPVGILKRGTNQKIRALFQDIGLADSIVDSFDDWKPITTRHLNDHDNVRSRVEMIFATNRAKITAYLDEVFDREPSLV